MSAILPVRNESQWRASYYLTRRCDLDCWYCCVPKVDAARSSELGAEGVRAVVGNLAAMGVDLVVLTGGEPFLRPDLLCPAMEACVLHGVYPVLLSNGRIVSTQAHGREKLRELADAIPQFGFSVSLDSAAAAGRTPSRRDDGSDQKSHYGLRALGIARDMGIRDLTATVVLDDAHPAEALDAIRCVRDAGYPVLVNLVQRASGTGDTTFRAAPIPLNPVLAGVAATILAHRDEWQVRNTPQFFENIVAGRHVGWACWEPGLVVVQPNGSVNLCNNVRGVLLPDLNLTRTGEQADSLRDQYARAWRQDLATSCPGCYLGCHVDFQYRHHAEAKR